MSVDPDVILEIDMAFAGCSKPAHFLDHTRCEECAEHDQLLRDRSRETLTIEDVGNVGWNPISFCDGAGIAYYFPTLARLAISSPTYEYGWYGDMLVLHLTSQGSDNRFLRFCDAQQRRAVSRLLTYLQAHLPKSMPGGLRPLADAGDFAEALALWGEP